MRTRARRRLLEGRLRGARGIWRRRGRRRATRDGEENDGGWSIL